MLAGQDDHGLGEHLQADGTDELLLQTLHDGECPGGDRRHQDTMGEDKGGVPEIKQYKEIKKQTKKKRSVGGLWTAVSSTWSVFRRTDVSRCCADMPLYVKGQEEA